MTRTFTHALRAPLRSHFVAACTMLLALALVAPAARAQDADRAGRTDLFLVGQYTIGDENEAQVFFDDVDIEYEDTFGIGGGIGINLNDHVNLTSRSSSARRPSSTPTTAMSSATLTPRSSTPASTSTGTSSTAR